MALRTLYQAADNVRGFSFKTDYNDVAHTLGVTITGASGKLELVVSSTRQVVLSLNCTGLNDGLRHIVAGPGATGLSALGIALPLTLPATLPVQIGMAGVPHPVFDCVYTP